MKILHIINYFQPQLDIMSILLRRSKKLGHDVFLVTSNYYFPMPGYDKSFKKILGPRKFDPGNKIIDGIKVFCLPIYYEQPGKRVLIKGLKTKLFEINPDLVIAHGEYTFYAFQSYLWKKNLNYKLIIDSHSHPHDTDDKIKVELNFFHRFKSFMFFLFIEDFYGLEVTYIGFQSSWNLNFFSKRCKIPLEKIELIAHGSEIDRFYPDSKIKKLFREKYNFGNDEIIIIYTGKISEKKCT